MLSEELNMRISQWRRQSRQITSNALSADEAAPSLKVDRLPLDNSDESVSTLPRGEEIQNAYGRHWIRRHGLHELWPHGDQWLSRHLVRLDQSRGSGPVQSAELSALADHLPNHVVYLDLETCGFAGSMVFLVGLICQQDGSFLLTQLLARNYAEEKPMLQTLWSTLAANRVLVTFNGKSFDWPMVHDRSTIHHLGLDPRNAPDLPVEDIAVQPADQGLSRDDPRPKLVHCDLLHHARRRWKLKLPDCKLQTLERHICRRRRTGDIPGRDIPAAYHDYVRSGDAWLIRNVLHHNALDLITLLQLSMLLTCTSPA